MTKNINSSLITELGLETLLKYGPQGQLEPDLATSWAQTSPVTYVYHLRHGVRFWDDHPLTAADAAYSLNYDRGPGSELAFAFTDVKTIVATDPYTVTVTLIQPDASWQYVPAEETSEVFEQHFQQAHKTSFGEPGTLVMGSGPWIINSLDPTKGAQVSANPHWWGGKVPIQRISFQFFSSETSEALAFRAGEIDIDLLGALPLYQYNLGKARAEMTQSGYPHGLSTTILAAEYGSVLDVTQVIAAELAKIGIRAQIKGLPVNVWQAALTGPASGRGAALSEGGCFQPDPSMYSDDLGSSNARQGSWNMAEYTPPAVDTLLAQGIATTNPAQRFGIYSQLFRRLQTDLPYIGLYTRDSTIALSPKFSYTDFSQWYWQLPWALSIRPAA